MNFLVYLKDFKHTLKHLKDELNLVELGSHLHIEEFLRAHDSNKPKGNNVASPLVVNMVEHNNYSRYNDNKGKRKHHDTKADPNIKSKVTCWKCGKPGHLKKDCKVILATKPMDQLQKGSVDGSSNSLKGENMDDDVAWWVNSGATVYVCKDRCWLKAYEKRNDRSILYMGNESTTLVHGRGCVDLRINIVNDNIGLSFMSTSKLNDSILWHDRLGNVHFKRMQDMSKDGLIPAFDMDTEKCKTCMMTKIAKKPFQNVKRETEVLELIYSDLCDLHATPSLGNNKYFVIFIDDASRFCYVYLLYTKDEALDKFKVFKIKVELQQRSLIKRFKTDREDTGGSVVPEEVTEEVVKQPEPKLRKIKRNRTPKEFEPEFHLSLIEGTKDEVSDQHSYCFNVVDDPKTFDEAMKSQDVAFWKEAINDEMDSIMGNNTWGYRQKSGIDYFDTYALVARISTIKLLIAMTSIHNLIIHQMDVKTTFLNGELEEEVYMNQPQGFIMPANENKMCKLIKSLYGLKQVPNKFDESGKGVISCLYVDDMLIFGIDQVQVDLTKEFLSSSTPMDTIEKLMPNNGQAVSQLEFSRVISFLLYAMTCIRPDIAFVVGKLSRYTSNPGTQHWQAIQKVLKYLNKIMDYRLMYTGYPSMLEGYTDASWINNTKENSSTSGWVFLLGGGAISWASKKQTCITGSTMEYEFVALATTVKETECAATLAKAYSQMYNGKSRHLGVRHSMIRELITNGVVSIEFVSNDGVDIIVIGSVEELERRSGEKEAYIKEALGCSLLDCRLILSRSVTLDCRVESALLYAKDIIHCCNECLTLHLCLFDSSATNKAFMRQMLNNQFSSNTILVTTHDFSDIILTEPESSLNRDFVDKQESSIRSRNNPPQHPRIVYPPILNINHFRHFLDILRNYDPIDDEPMRAADRVVAPTPNSAITIPETANEFAIKGNAQKLHGHNLSKGNIIQIFYHGLNEITQEVLNAVTGGIFLYKTPNQAHQLLEDKVLLKLDWAKNQKTKSSFKKTIAFADEGNSNSDTDKIMTRMDAMTIKMDAQYKKLQAHAKQPTPDLDDDDIPMSREEEAKFMQTFFIDAYGADALWLYIINSPLVLAEPLRFKEKGVYGVVSYLFVRKKLQQLEQVANLSTYPSRFFNSFCYDDDDDDDDDEEYTIAITHVLPTEEPDNSLSIGDEHLSTIPETESDELIKSSVENHVPIPSESEDFSDIESECDMPVCDDFTTFSNLLFDADGDFSSSDDESFSNEDVPKENFKIFSNPLSDEEIISTKIDPHHFNAESDLIESLLNRDTLIISSPKFDSLLEEFFGKLAHIDLIPPGTNEVDFDPEEEIRLVEKLLYDNSAPRPPEEFNSENSDAVIESFSLSPIPVEDSDSLMEEIDLFLTPDDSMPPGIENDDYDSKRDILFLEELLSNDSLSLHENESFHFDVPSSPRPPAKPPDDGIYFEPDTGVFTKVVDDISDNSTRELYVHVPNVLTTDLMNKCAVRRLTSSFLVLCVLCYMSRIAPDYEASRARGFVLRSLELHTLNFIMGIEYPNLID
ncbi:zinc finger, CCHC-type containing protein [Tanacetum coccineum]